MNKFIFFSVKIIPSEANTLRQTPISSAAFGFVRHIISSANPKEFKASDFLNIKIPILEIIVTIPALITEPLKPVKAINRSITKEEIKAENLGVNLDFLSIHKQN